MSKLKIIFNTDQVYRHGGIEKVLATKANYLASQPDMKVYVVTTEQQGHPPRYPLDKRVQLIDLSVNYNRTRSYFSWENLKKALAHFRRQIKLFQEIKPDVIISPNFNFDHYWLPFVQSAAKKIKEIHSSRYNRQSSWKSRLDSWIERRYDKIVVLNSDEASYIDSDNVVVIPNPVPKQGDRCSLDRKQVIAAGRIAPVKGFDELIAAWKVVHATYPDWQLHIYGDDYLGTQEQLQQAISNDGLQDVIAFQGNVDDLPRAMLDYSIYAMSSVTECFPMVLLEALSVGLPIVSYDCPNGPRHIIPDNRGGILVRQRKPQELANALMQLMGDVEERKRMGEKAIAQSEKFTIDPVMQKWLSLLRN